MNHLTAHNVARLILPATATREEGAQSVGDASARALRGPPVTATERANHPGRRWCECFGGQFTFGDARAGFQDRRVVKRRADAWRADVECEKAATSHSSDDCGRCPNRRRV